MTYLGQFFKKFGTSSRPALQRTNTSPVLMNEEKQKQLAALSEVRQRFGVGKGTDSFYIPAFHPFMILIFFRRRR